MQPCPSGRHRRNFCSFAGKHSSKFYGIFCFRSRSRQKYAYVKILHICNLDDLEACVIMKVCFEDSEITMLLLQKESLFSVVTNLKFHPALYGQVFLQLEMWLKTTGFSLPYFLPSSSFQEMPLLFRVLDLGMPYIYTLRIAAHFGSSRVFRLLQQCLVMLHGLPEACT